MIALTLSDRLAREFLLAATFGLLYSRRAVHPAVVEIDAPVERLDADLARSSGASPYP